MEILEAVRAVLDWADEAPALLEGQVLRQLDRVEAGLSQLDLSGPVYLEWARLWAFRGDNQRALSHLEKLLSYPDQLQNALDLLRSLDAPQYERNRQPRPYQPVTLANWSRLHKLLADLPAILETRSVELVKQRCVQFLAETLRPHQAFWLEEDEVVAYQGPPGFAFYSRTLLERARQDGELLSEPEQASAYESLILSEARGVMIVMLPDRKAALYVSHKDFSGRFQAEELSILRLLAQIAHSHLEAREIHQQRLEADQVWMQQRRQLSQSYQDAALGLAWLDESGVAVEANTAFSERHASGKPFWESLWGPDRHAGQVWFSQPLGRQILRCRYEGVVRWQAYYLEGIRGHQLCVVQDLSDQHWRESILVLERERHWLAADLHDGPAQQEAARALLGEPQQTDKVRDLIAWLRSPLLAGDSPEEAFRALAAHLLPAAVWVWETPPQAWSPPWLLVYRLLQEALEFLKEHTLEGPLRLLEHRLEGASFATFQPSSAVAERLRLFGHWSAGPAGLEWSLKC